MHSPLNAHQCIHIYEHARVLYYKLMTQKEQSQRTTVRCSRFRSSFNINAVLASSTTWLFFGDCSEIWREVTMFYIFTPPPESAAICHSRWQFLLLYIFIYKPCRRTVSWPTVNSTHFSGNNLNGLLKLNLAHILRFLSETVIKCIRKSGLKNGYAYKLVSILC